MTSDANDGTIRVAVVGAGLIGAQRAVALASITGARLVATVDPNIGPPALGVAVPHYSSLGDLDSADFDVAIIATPHDVAVELAGDILRAGKPILVEKPLGTTGPQARELERLASAIAKPSFVGYNYRFLPAVVDLFACLASGALGTLRNIDLLIGHGGHPRSAEGWKLDPRRAGGGVLIDPGVHLLDLLLLMAPTASCRSAIASRGFWGTGIEEDVVLAFESDRLIATVRVSHVRWVNTFRLEVFGEDGYALVDGRGGNYGEMSLRLGRRWAWAEPGPRRGQRETEELRSYGSENRSLEAELASVVLQWAGSPVADTFPGPATMAEARAVTELCDEVYARMSANN